MNCYRLKERNNYIVYAIFNKSTLLLFLSLLFANNLITYLVTLDFFDLDSFDIVIRQNASALNEI